MSSFSVNERYVRMDAYNLCARTLTTYISVSESRVAQWVAKTQNSMNELGDNIPTKEQTITYLQIMLDGLQHGNWPKELVGD